MVSMQNLIVILIIIILLFGAKKIPELAKGVGQGIKVFKKEMEDDEKVEAVENEKVETKKDESKEQTKA